MTNRTDKNSILFIATLGVYIGLLMAGATPGVIAQQAAMTRNFELSEEIDVTDDLEKKPAGDLAAQCIDAVCLDHLVEESVARFICSLPSATSDGSVFLSAAASNEIGPTLPSADHARPVASFTRAQIFTVSRLPRAGLDALLAKDAK